MIYFNFNYNYLKETKIPDIFLAKAGSRNILGNLKTKMELESTFYFNNISECSFKYQKYINGELAPLYDQIENNMEVLMVGFAWFHIISCNEKYENGNFYKDIQCKSIEDELCSKRMTSFGQLGVEEDEQGGLDRYALYNIEDPDHSVLHIIVKSCPSWSIGYIDPTITTERRTIDVDETDAYSLLTDTCSNIYKCIFQFDSFEKTISAYNLENMNDLTGIYLSYRNLINSTEFTCNLSDIKTVLYVSGGDYQGKGNLTINAVNPSGNNYISNFEYYYKLMTPNLVEKLKMYKNAYENNKTYEQNLQSLKDYEVELTKLIYEPHRLEDDKIYSTYCMTELQTEHDKLEQLIGVLNGDNDDIKKKMREEYFNTLYGNSSLGENDEKCVMYSYNKRKNEIENLKQKIEIMKQITKNETISLEDFLTIEERKELDSFVRQDTYSNTSYVATTEMTEDEILDMKQSLLDEAVKELRKVSQPSYTLKINCANFFMIDEFKTFSEQLQLGSLITVDFDETYSGKHYIQSRLLKVHIDWDNFENFELEFASKTNLDGKYAFEEVTQQAQSSYSSIDKNHTGYNLAKNQTTTVSKFMNDNFNASKNKLMSNDNEEVEFGSSGIRLRKWLPEKQGYSEKQSWITSTGFYLSKDSFRNVLTILGELIAPNGESIYGLNTELLVGKLIMGNYLYIENSNATLKFNDDGLVIMNGESSVTINPNTDKLFRLSYNGKDYIYFDKKGNAQFEGDITGSIITGSEFYARNGDIEFHISPRDKNIIEIKKGNGYIFYVDENGNGVFSGNVVGSKIIGGSINIADGSFKVDQETGFVTSNVGKYGGFWIGNGSIVGLGETDFDVKVKQNGDGSYSATVYDSGVPIETCGYSKFPNDYEIFMLQEKYRSQYNLRNSFQAYSSKNECALSIGYTPKFTSNKLLSDYLGWKSGKFVVFQNGRCKCTALTITTYLYGSSIGTTDSVIYAVSNTTSMEDGKTHVPSVGWVKGYIKNNINSLDIDADIRASSNGNGNYVRLGKAELATTGWCANTFAKESWVRNNFATESWVRSNFARNDDDSDIRLKENISNLDPKLKNVYTDLKPKSFSYKTSNTDDKTVYGLVANDVKDTLLKYDIDLETTKLVYEVENNKFNNETDLCKDGKHLRIDYHSLHAMHIQMIQDLNKEIINHKEIISKQNENISNLENEISDLKLLVNKLLQKVGD